MEYNPNNPAYTPTDISANELILQSMREVFRAGKVPRDF